MLGRELPIHIEAVAVEIGLHIMVADFRDDGLVPVLTDEFGYSESELEEKGITSDAYRDNDGMVTAEEDFFKVCVFLHSDLGEERRRWVCAHEIGHYLLGHLPRVDAGELRNRSREAAADWVAAQLLMPEPLVREVVAIVGLDYRLLAHTFGVRIDRMKIRLRELGLAKRGETEAQHAPGWAEFCIYPW
jgi:Zn-dependent peptidase ImmA (M78 family)